MSNSEFRMLINNLTQDMLDLYGIQIPITDMTNVVALLGGRVVEISDLGKMPAGNMKREGEGFVIYIPSFSSQGRKNWGIAQELGHLFLHMGYRISPALWDKYNDESFYHSKDVMEEYQANEFAAALLMPQETYEKITAKNTTGNIVHTRYIADFFGTTVVAVSNRGMSLGYLG